MADAFHYWPVFVFIAGLFSTGVGIAVALTMWIMGRLAEQDSRRVEMKDLVLSEIRDLEHAIAGRFDTQRTCIGEKFGALQSDVNELMNRMVRVETVCGKLVDAGN